MTCVFKQASCGGIPPGTLCFACENCEKRLIVAEALASRINELTRSFPPCQRPPNAVMIPSANAVITAAPAAQPQPPAQPPAQPYKWDPAGAGTQLKKLLAKVGITSTENCSCNARARVMNEKGIEWCEQNVPEIVSWLKEEAGRRKLPFLSLPAKIVVQRAIKIAKRIRDNQPAESSSAEEAESSSAA